MKIAERNRAIKRLLSNAFGQGKVTVKGSRGTSYGWVRVRIAYAPRDYEELRQLKAKIWALFRLSGLDKEIDSYDSGDYGSGRNIHIDFDRVCATRAA